MSGVWWASAGILGLIGVKGGRYLARRRWGGGGGRGPQACWASARMRPSKHETLTNEKQGVALKHRSCYIDKFIQNKLLLFFKISFFGGYLKKSSLWGADPELWRFLNVGPWVFFQQIIWGLDSWDTSLVKFCMWNTDILTISIDFQAIFFKTRGSPPPPPLNLPLTF